ncbi:hypothetical protein predicted by Glimmer/Critica [Salmonella enterica subsp. enterica serovar Weltevreden str. 2007-60-3289-1]|nr:hypothetical protein predicted by Glimmer/Critica [Salmonella enterica subsp. enterica serovar Weltevreden str. 2007-60-3289-1]
MYEYRLFWRNARFQEIAWTHLSTHKVGIKAASI